MISSSSKLHKLTVEFNNGNTNTFVYESDLSIQSYHVLFNLKDGANGILASFNQYGLGLRWKDVSCFEVKIME